MPLQVRPASLQAYLPLDQLTDGTSADGITFIDMSGIGNTGAGDDGANNTGLAATAGEAISYPPSAILAHTEVVVTSSVIINGSTMVGVTAN